MSTNPAKEIERNGNAPDDQNHLLASGCVNLTPPDNGYGETSAAFSGRSGFRSKELVQ
jgi:hypothetical protein